MKPRDYYNDLLAQKLIEEFEKRNIEGYYCHTKEEALKKVLDMMPEGSTVSNGGSATFHEVGLDEALKNGPYHFLDPNGVQGAAAKDGVAHQALGSDYYIMSSNAITEAGELVNSDGYGNRVAALIFGPKHVIIIAGLNKVEPDLESAVRRVKTYAASNILLRFKQDYPSYDELIRTAEKSCSQLVITSMSAIKGRIKVVLVAENLGY